ncbi:ABC transporter permease [Pseudonocardia tropica]|uniref:Transport permease protein n=1 Tax=Pseudonocardia tropica TaxID=681289 RepID=A0ABV1K207_9PSEU
MSTLSRALSDGTVIARRNLLMILRVPELLVNSAVAPIMMTLLFGFIIGGAIDTPGVGYREYLMPGIFVQALLMGAVTTGTAMASDIRSGIVDRLRSMPISRSAVLVGRTTSDLANNSLVILVTAVLGLLVGWRINTSSGDALLGFALLLAFAYALSWVMATIGLAMPVPEVVSNASFTVAIPLGFLSNAYVPLESLPGPLQVVATWNPISALVQATRELFGNAGAEVPPTAWPLQNPVLATVLWTALLLVIFVPLAVRQYWRAVSR